MTELSLYDAGVTALSELHDLPSMTSLRSLNLHSNRVARISHLEPLVRLRSLNLSSNQIEVMEGLHALRQLEVLDLSCNRIRMIDGLAALGQLRRLLLGYNRIDSLAGLVQCQGGPLEHFEAHGNEVAFLQEAEYLGGLPALSEVVLQRHGQRNPLCALPGYRDHVLRLLPRLRRLDGQATAAADFATAPAAAAVAPRPAWGARAPSRRRRRRRRTSSWRANGASGGRRPPRAPRRADADAAH